MHFKMVVNNGYIRHLIYWSAQINECQLCGCRHFFVSSSSEECGFLRTKWTYLWAIHVPNIIIKERQSCIQLIWSQKQRSSSSAISSFSYNYCVTFRFGRFIFLHPILIAEINLIVSEYPICGQLNYFQ